MAKNTSFYDEDYDDIFDDDDVEEDAAEETDEYDEEDDADDDDIFEDVKKTSSSKKKSKFSNAKPVIAIALCSLMVGSSFFYLSGGRLTQPQKAAETPVETVASNGVYSTSHTDPADPLSPENLTKSVNEGFIAPYLFLMYGDNQAVNPDNPDDVNMFTFSTNGSYLGKFMDNKDDHGTYNMFCEGDDVVLEVLCHGETERYTVSLNDDADIRLSKDGKDWDLHR